MVSVHAGANMGEEQHFAEDGKDKSFHDSPAV